MVHISVIEARLSQLGVRITALFRPEILELQRILVDGEEIVSVVPGRYFGGFALLAATDRRLLLIDKKMAVLSVQDIRYDMISEVDFGARMLDSTLVLFTVNKQHRFSSFKHRHKLRELTTYVQQQVMELRYGQSRPESRVGSPPARQDLAQYSDTAPRIVRSLHHVPKLVGAAALHDTPWSVVNPYTRTSLMIRHQWSRPTAQP